MAAQKQTYQGKGAFSMRKLGFDGSKQITGASSPAVTFATHLVRSISISAPAKTGDAATEKIEDRLIDGTTIGWDDNTTRYKGIDGTEDASSSGEAEKITVEITDTDPLTVELFMNNRGEAFQFTVPHGETGSNVKQDYHGIGVITNAIEINFGASAVVGLSIEFTLKSYAATTPGDTFLKTVWAAVPRLKFTDYTPEPVTDTELARLKSGLITMIRPA